MLRPRLPVEPTATLWRANTARALAGERDIVGFARGGGQQAMGYGHALGIFQHFVQPAARLDRAGNGQRMVLLGENPPAAVGHTQCCSDGGQGRQRRLDRATTGKAAGLSYARPRPALSTPQASAPAATLAASGRRMA